MPCPFLNRFPSFYVRNYGTSLLKLYGNHCPVMSRMMSDGTNKSEPISPPTATVAPTKCPFLAEVNNSFVKEASKEIQVDIIESGATPLKNGKVYACYYLRFLSIRVFFYFYDLLLISCR